MTSKSPTLAEIRAAQARCEGRARIEPRADRVRYDAKSGLIMLDLRGGAILGLPVDAIRELAGAKPNQLKAIRAGFGGESITLEDLDVDISIPGLLRDLVGMTSAATLLGRKGGSVTSEAKAAAVRENGKLGGRPRKAPQPARSSR
jgi:Protein of unknown function (DUF2442)